MTGTAVDTNAEYANTASIMRYTLANVESGSIKLWCVVRGAPAAFALPLLLRLCCAVPWHNLPNPPAIGAGVGVRSHLGSCSRPPDQP